MFSSFKQQHACNKLKHDMKCGNVNLACDRIHSCRVEIRIRSRSIGYITIIILVPQFCWHSHAFRPLVTLQSQIKVIR